MEEVREIAGWGILDGVTTNPSLMAKEKGDYRVILKTICDLGKGPVSGEVISLNSEAMVREAKDIASLSEHMVIKIPCTVEGLKATKALEAEDIHVNMTLVFSANQALLAAKAGASYISPFVGRLDDIGNPGIDVVQDILSILETEHVRQAALCGCHVATIPYKVFTQLVRHALTDIGIERFLKDWQSR
jgi:transaldolase